MTDEERNHLENDHDAEGQNIASRVVEHETRHRGADESPETETDFQDPDDDAERASAVGVCAHGRIRGRHAADAKTVGGGE